MRGRQKADRRHHGQDRVATQIRAQPQQPGLINVLDAPPVQRLTRVQGSTIHLRCGNGGRSRPESLVRAAFARRRREL